MKLLVVSATEFEIAPFLSHFNLKPGKNYLDGNEVVVLVTGVGMVATSFAMGRLLASEMFEIAINAGIAGSFKEEIGVGEVVEVIEDQFSELGAMDDQFFLAIDELGFGSSIMVPVRNETLGNLLLPERKTRGITVNCVHGNIEEISSLRKRLDPDVESMEGAAFFYSCNQVQLRSVQLRSISNYVERRDKSRWNIPLAIEKLNTRLIDLYTALK